MIFRKSLRAACLAGFAMALSGMALAHSENQSTTPADGAVLDASPEVLAMTFDEPMRLTLVLLTDADGAEIEVQRTDDMAPVTEFEASPAEMGPGAYTLQWRGLSSDGHPMDGSFSFQIAD